tara:strand:+ start:390 stop:686 length:297 start_codon:yes stop_codon:yes gene_type:complete
MKKKEKLLYQTDAIDKNGIARTYGLGETAIESIIQAEISIREKFLRKLKEGVSFPLVQINGTLEQYTYETKRIETDEERDERIKRDNASIQRVDAQCR